MYAPQEGSERALKELGATSSFTIHTKAPGFVKGSGTKASILAAAKQSFQDLGVKSVCFACNLPHSGRRLTSSVKVETYFVHSPDSDTPIEQTVDAMQLVYASGRYKHVSNLACSDASECSALKLVCSTVRSVKFRARGCEEGI